LRGGSEGYSDSLIGYIMSGYFVGFFVGFYMAMPMLRRVGHIRSFALCAAIAACVVLMHLLIVNPWAWMVLRVVTGAVLVILYTIIESWLNDQTESSRRGQVFAIYMAVNLGSLALAQQFLRFGDAGGYALFAVAAMLVCISLVPITWTRMAQPVVSETASLGVRKLYKMAPVAVVAAVLSGIAMGAFWGMGPVFAQRIGLTDNSVAMFMSCAILGGALFQYPLGRLSDKYDRRLVLAAVNGAGMLLAVLMWILPAEPLVVLTLISLWGGASFAVYPVAIAHLVDHLEPGEILSGGSGLLLLHGIGAAIGPALAGQIMSLTGPLALVVYFAVTHLGIVLFAAFVLKAPDKIEEPEDTAPFVPMVRTTPTALEMLPEDMLEEHSESPSESEKGSEAESETESTSVIHDYPDNEQLDDNEYPDEPDMSSSITSR
ncbi:MAG: MFS transporter, partial [Oceanobacter sp.]